MINGSDNGQWNVEHLRKLHQKYITPNDPEWALTLNLRGCVSSEFATLGHLTLKTFDSVLDWKLRQQRKRTEKHRSQNNNNLIRELTGAFWRVQHDSSDKLLEIKLKILQSIPGVGIGVASTILTLSNPANFAIIDFRNWKVLYAQDKQGFTVSEYKKYLADMQKLASQLHCDVQEIDFILWKEFETLP
jgi:hypothetical protein